jgi:DNA-binding PadR family transcriptional regulator
LQNVSFIDKINKSKINKISLSRVYVDRKNGYAFYQTKNIKREAGVVMPAKKNNYETLLTLIIGLYILKILQQGATYGNKLANEIKRRTQDAYTPNTNALYPLLRIMEERGYIVGEWDSPVTRGKRIFTITEVGIARIAPLEIMLEERIQGVERRMTILRTDLLGQ